MTIFDVCADEPPIFNVPPALASNVVVPSESIRSLSLPAVSNEIISVPNFILVSKSP